MFSFYQKFVEKQAFKRFEFSRNNIIDPCLILFSVAITLTLAISLWFLWLSALDDNVMGLWQLFAISAFLAFLFLMFILRTSYNIRKYAATAFKKAEKGSLFFEYNSNRIPVGEGKEFINIFNVEKRRNKVVEVTLPQSEFGNDLLCETMYKFCHNNRNARLFGSEIELILNVDIAWHWRFNSNDVINYFIRDHQEKDGNASDNLPLIDEFDLVSKLKNDIIKILHIDEIENGVVAILKAGLTDTDFLLSAKQRYEILGICTSALMKNELLRGFSNIKFVSVLVESITTDSPKIEIMISKK